MTSQYDNPFLNTEVHYVDSDAVGAEYKILIGRSGLKSDVDPVVLFLVDADLCFGGSMNTIRGLQLAGWLPPILVVGIGYRVADLNETYTLRSRDFTPSEDVATTKRRGWMSGGADRFCQFIKEELKPWVAGHFAVDPDDDVFFGHSLGGLFGAHVLVSEPRTFKRYGLGSASLWHDRGSIFEAEAARAQTNLDMAARVYFSVGAYEGPDGDRLQLAWLPEDKRADAEAKASELVAAFGEVSMVADQERFVAALRSRNYPNLVVESDVLPGEFHTTAAPLNFSRSMRYLFDAPR